MTDSPFQQFLRECQQRTEAALERSLPPPTQSPASLHQAMRYAVLDGGKRVRPVLVYAAGRALGVEPRRLDAPAVAVELIHAYSLIHDDLPAMDDDDLRRGRPSCHKAFDEATAILAGDSLQPLAFHVLCTDEALGVPAETRLQMVDLLAVASGSRGMAGGQALDLAAEGQELDLPQLENLHIHKTGALIRAGVQLGALAAPLREVATMQRLDHYAKCVGLAFQVRDDILDVEGDSATLGKTTGKDKAQAKATYPALLGMEESRRMARRLCDDALASLDPLDERADPLRWIAEYIVARRS
jgi:geranylgeranyl pyrophosphate synthase